MSRRILFVIDSLFPLGPSFQLRLLANALQEHGNQIHVVALEEPWESELSWQFPGSTVYGLRKGIIRGGRHLVLARRLSKLIRDIRPEIVHGWCDPASSICRLAIGQKSSIELMTTELWKLRKRSLAQKLMLQKAGRRPTVNVVPVDSLRQHLLETMGMEQSAEVDVIPSGTSPPRSNQADSRKRIRDQINVDNDTKVVAAVAPLMPRTRMKDLIWATDLLVCVRDDIHFAIFGQGPQEPQLRRFLSLTEASANVHFLGNHPDVLQLIHGADLVWHAHLDEALPSGLLHAMSGGIPVVSVYGPETAPLILPQTTGLAVNYGARDEFARWTKYLVELPESADQLARQGKEHVEKDYSVDSMVESYVRLYDSILT